MEHDKTTRRTALETTYQRYIERERQTRPDETLMNKLKQRQAPTTIGAEPSQPTNSGWQLPAIVYYSVSTALVAFVLFGFIFAYQLRNLVSPWLQEGKQTPKTQGRTQPPQRYHRYTPLPSPGKQSPSKRKTPVNTKPRKAPKKNKMALSPKIVPPKRPPTSPNPLISSPFTRRQQTWQAYQPSVKQTCPGPLARRQIKIAVAEMPKTLNPLEANTLMDHRATEPLFDRLIERDRNDAARPSLALHWTIKKGVLRFLLRKGVKWHDGKPFTARDVAFTLRAAIAHKRTWQDLSLSQLYDKIVIVNPWEIHIHLKVKPKSIWGLSASGNHPGYVLRLFEQKILPKHRFPKGYELRTLNNHDHLSDSQKVTFAKNPIGTGPFKLVRWRGQKLIYGVFKGYWRKQSCIRGLKIQSIPDHTVAKEVFQYGALDAVLHLRSKDLQRWSGPKPKMHKLHVRRWWFLGFNQQRHFVLRIKTVRHAIALAIDSERFRKQFGGKPIGWFSQMGYPLASRGARMAEAKRLLGKLGWRFGKKKRKLYTLRLAYAWKSSAMRELAQHIRERLGQLQFDVKLNAHMPSRWQREVFQQRKFDLVLDSMVQPSRSMPAPLLYKHGGHNYIRFQHYKAQKLWESLMRYTHRSYVKKGSFVARMKLARLLREEMPVVPLWQDAAHTVVVGSRLQHYWLHPFRLFRKIHRWHK